MLKPQQLRIDDLVGTVRVISPGEEITLGRAGTFVIGEDDPYMHRKLLHIWHSADVWNIANVGRSIPVVVQPMVAGSYAKIHLGAKAVMPIPAGPSAIVFATTECEYEIRVQNEPRAFAFPTFSPAEAGTRPTLGRFYPNEEQTLLLQALAEPLRARPGADISEAPTVRQLAEKLNWTEKKVNSKIDYLCKTLAEHGTRGFSGRDQKVISRRFLLAQYALETM